MENKEQQIADTVKNKLSENDSQFSEKEIRDLIKKEIISSNYIKADDWHIDYAVDRIYPMVYHDFLYKTKTVTNDGVISVEKADKKARGALNSAYIAIVVIF